MGNREYVLTNKVKRRLEGRGKPMICAACGKSLEPGQKIHRTPSGTYYHLKCFKNLFY